MDYDWLSAPPIIEATSSSDNYFVYYVNSISIQESELGSFPRKILGKNLVNGYMGEKNAITNIIDVIMKQYFFTSSSTN